MEEREELPVGEMQRPSLGVERLQIGSALLGVAFIFLFGALMQVLVDLLVGALAPALRETDWYPWLLSSASLYLFAMPLSLILFRLGRGEAPVRGERLTLPMLLGLIALCFALAYAGNFLGAIVNAVIGAVTGKLPENELETMTSSAPLWTNFLCVGILAPVLEEIFFRKLVIDRLRRYGDLFAMLASGVLFGLIHGNFYQFFYAAAMGVLFGYVYLRTGRLRYTVILHVTVNLVGAVYTAEMLKLISPILEAENPAAALLAAPAGALMLSFYLCFMLLCLAGAVAAAILLYRYWVRGHRFSPAARRLTRGEWVRVLLLNPALWIFSVFCVLLFL